MKKFCFAIMCVALGVMAASCGGNATSNNAVENASAGEAPAANTESESEPVSESPDVPDDRLTGTKWSVSEELDLSDGKTGKREYNLTFAKGGKAVFAQNDYDESGNLDKTTSEEFNGTYQNGGDAASSQNWQINLNGESGRIFIYDDGEMLDLSWRDIDQTLVKY
ncbi:MAG: hypothetical protein J6Y82_10790 [Bacteroidales bacterium]|nr:hypothetical protein [Bacteroidales bacterium]